MLKKNIKRLVAAMLLMCFMVVMGGCDIETTNELLDMYTFRNYSSYEVTLIIHEGTRTISRGGSVTGQLPKGTTMDDVYYSPANLVSVTQAGRIFTFNNW